MQFLGKQSLVDVNELKLIAVFPPLVFSRFSEKDSCEFDFNFRPELREKTIFQMKMEDASKFLMAFREREKNGDF